VSGAERSPYAPPGVEVHGGKRSPEGPGYLPLVGAVLGIGTGVVLAASQIVSLNLFGSAAFSLLFYAHASLAFGAVLGLLLAFVPGGRLGVPRIALEASLLGAVILGAAGLAGVARIQWVLNALLVPVLAVTAGAAVLWLWRSRAPLVTRVLFAGAALTQCVPWAAAFAHAGFFARTRYDVFLPIALAVVVRPLVTRESLREGPIAATVLYALSHIVASLFGFGLAVLVEVPAGTALAVLALRAAGKVPCAWSRWTRRAEVVLFMHGGALAAFFGMLDVDVHLPDTLFATGTLHLQAFVAVFEGLRWLPRAARRRAGWVGLSTTFVGAETFCTCLVTLGARGNPLRYAGYLTRYTTLHQVAAIGAFALVIGLTVVLLADLAQQKRRAAA
jgi:hypothetical protein